MIQITRQVQMVAWRQGFKFWSEMAKFFRFVPIRDISYFTMALCQNRSAPYPIHRFGPKFETLHGENANESFQWCKLQNKQK